MPRELVAGIPGAARAALVLGGGRLAADRHRARHGRPARTARGAAALAPSARPAPAGAGWGGVGGARRRRARFLVFFQPPPPVADEQRGSHADHNPRSNERALATYLAAAAARSRARFVVCAGHLHTYERREQDGIVYLVSGGGGARPVEVVRDAADRYQ